MSWLSRIENGLFKPPYGLIPWVVFLFLETHFFGSVLNHPPIDLSEDPDDYMRLNQTMSWMLGQGWYDLSQPRMSPGAHTVVHWARCVDIPIALAALPFIKWLGLREAVLTGSLIAPMLPFALLIVAVREAARPFTGRARANLALLFFMFAPAAYTRFGAGRVDHHGWDMLIACTAFACLHRALLCHGGWQAALTASVALAFGLWIGGEIMPFLVLMTCGIGLASAWRGGFALRNAAVFGAGLAAFTALMLPIALPPNEWASLKVSWFSAAYVVLAGLIGLGLSLSWLLGRMSSSAPLRVGLVAALGFQALAAFLWMVPSAVSGPFADYDAYNGSQVLDSIQEAMPYTDFLGRQLAVPYGWGLAAGTVAMALFAPLAALVFCLWAFFRTRFRRRMLWAIYALFMGTFIAAGLFVQGRILWFAQSLPFAALAALTWCWWDRAAKGWTPWHRYRAAMLCFFLIGLMPTTVVYYEMQHVRMLDANATRIAPLRTLRGTAEFIAQRYNDRFHTIMASPNEGPGLLFFTMHNVIGGYFNVPGNPDVADFYSATDEATALGILAKWHADIVLAPQTGAGGYLRESPDGRDDEVGKGTMLDRLIHGPLPPWLKPVEIPGASGYLLFEVQSPEQGGFPP